MTSTAFEYPPIDLDPELEAYLVRVLTVIVNALGESNKLEVMTRLPDRPRNGLIYYFGIILLPDITTPGFWGFEEGAWVKL